MPPQLLFDIAQIDLNKVLFDKEAIRDTIPHRGPIEQLDAVVYGDGELGRMVGYKDVRDDEFWVGGHIPGRPLLPGVLMVEAAAQLASMYMAKFEKWDGFIGFGGVDGVRFRQQVPPGNRLVILLQRIRIGHGRFIGKSQGLVNGNLAFEAEIHGVRM
ncbi:MAG TPA: 3-hydroxyacyl-ACP dehydratase FabZ family protein [Tepidisphaeraceae bacterium]|nr:3-hydroxyacyl-ACP dehydratase FabZ family protein [Tepidisphaeraceae bacterium]